VTQLSNEADFIRFMEANGPPSEGGKNNYLSWLRYVNELYRPNFDALTEADVSRIISGLRETRGARDRYRSDSAIADIKSALNKYLAYVSTGNQGLDVVDDISAVLGGIDTTFKTEIEARLGQGGYRNALIAIWRKCAVTQFDRLDLLVASHIKPWRMSNRNERLDPYNGLLLSPNLDKLFDRGYISFDADGKILISSRLDESDRVRLAISPSMKLFKTEERCLPYLQFHRNQIFQ